MLKDLEAFGLQALPQQPRQPPVVHAAAAQHNLFQARSRRASTAALHKPAATPA
jgi:hypothetical protein